MLLTAIFFLANVWAAKWIGPDPRMRPDEDFGAAEWIAAPADTNGVTTLTYAFDCEEIPADRAVEMVSVAVPEYGIEVNGKTFYKWSGHVRDARYPVFRDMRPWLRAGRNEVAVRLTGAGERAFIAKIVRPGQPVLTTGADWTSPQGAVRTLGRMRETEFGKRAVLRTETIAPAFAKTFRVKGPVRTAQLRVTGVGFYEAHLNGRKIGDKVLDPSPTAYDKRVLYSTYDLKADLKDGENELLVLLGHGWYDNRAVATWNFEVAPWRDFPRTIAQLEIAYADGTRETVATDASWRQVTNPVAYDDIYEGEVVDGRITAGAALPGAPLFAVEVEGPRGRLVPEEQPGAKVMEEIKATAVHPLGDDACMIEFPVNVSGWMRLPLFGQKSGDVVSFRYDERANADGTPAAESVRDGLHDEGALSPRESRHIDQHFRYPASFRICAKDAAFQCDRYICRGEDGETYEPRFSYKGFRYVYVRGLSRLPKPEDAVARFVHTGFETIGSFTCSDATFNRLMEMGVRAYKSNFTDGVPTDCPHREKNGWTGDASIASELAQYLFENTAGYEKWLRDIVDAQRPDGDIPGIVPTSGWGFDWGNGPAWDSALPVIAWNLWIYRGNRRMLDEIYPALKRYLAFTATKADADGLVRHGLGDWVPVNREHMPTVEFTSSCYYYQAQRIAAEIAKLKGLPSDAEAYAASAAKTRAGLRTKFAKPDGVWENGGQTAQGMALAFGLVDAAERPAAERQLVASVERTDGHIDMGLLGTKHVFRALSRAGRTDLAWKMLTNPTSPSPADWIRKGGTTLWEDWKDGSSRNHIMFGDFVGWAYQYLAGIRLAETDGSTSAVTLPAEPAFRRVVVEPVFLQNLDSLSASVRLPGGKLGVSWERKGYEIAMTVTVPPETMAKIRVPHGDSVERGAGMWTFRFPSADLPLLVGDGIASGWPVLRTYEGEFLRRVKMPIGGIGTGTISLTGTGALVDWEIRNAPDKGFTPNAGVSPCFAIRAETEDGKVAARLLEGPVDTAEYEGGTGSPARNHGFARWRSCRFRAAYPLAQVELQDPAMPVEATLEAMNPLVKDDAEKSGIPAALLRWKVRNPTGGRIRASLICFMVNPAGGTSTVGRVVSDGLKGIRLGSSSVESVNERLGEIALVASEDAGEISSAIDFDQSNWRTGFDGIWRRFVASGRAEDYADEESGGRKRAMASVAVAFELAPGETRSVPFALGWRFPHRRAWSAGCRDGVRGPFGAAHDVGNFYAVRYPTALAAAADLMGNLADYEAKTIGFVREVLTAKAPDVVKEAALFNLSTLRTETCLRTADGHFFGWEGCLDNAGSCEGSCTHVWGYEHALIDVWPSLAKDMTELQFGPAMDARGCMRFRIALPLEKNGTGKPMDAADGHMQCIVKAYENWKKTGDDVWMRKLYPRIRLAMEFTWLKDGWDADRDGVMEGSQHNTMDVEYFGPNPQMEFLYLAALKAMAAMADRADDIAFAAECRALAAKGSNWTERNLFNGAYYEHKVVPMKAKPLDGTFSGSVGNPSASVPDYQLGAGCLVDQLLGDYAARAVGLGPVADGRHAKTTLDTILAKNASSNVAASFNHMRDFAFPEEPALKMAWYPAGTMAKKPFPYYGENMTGFEYVVAANLVQRGDFVRAEKVVRDIRSRYDGRKRNPFDEAECGHHYARALAAWSVLTAFRNREEAR